MEYLRATIFRDKVFLPSDDVIVSIGITSLSHRFWIQLVSVVLLGSTFNAVVAVLVYHTCLCTDKKQQHQKSLSYLIGYGVVIPCLLFVPFGIAQGLELQNRAIKVASASGSVLLVFRCLEAMHGTAPRFATSGGLKQYVLYYVATIQFDFDDRTGAVQPATASWLRRQLVRSIQLFLETSILFSVLVPRNFQLVSMSNLQSGSFAASALAHLVNNLAMAMLTSLCLDVGATGLGLITSALTQLKTLEIHDHPITRSTSPGDFWGRRWNVLVGSALKRGVYLPLRQAGHSRSIAAFATFVASGVLHEYIVALILYRSQGTATESKTDTSVSHLGAVVGMHSLFFVWNGLVLVGEELLRDTKLLHAVVRHVPRPVRTAMVVLIVLPVSHLFTSVYVDTGFYNDYSVGFPRFVLSYR